MQAMIDFLAETELFKSVSLDIHDTVLFKGANAVLLMHEKGVGRGAKV